MEQKIGHYSFIGGVLLAVVLGLFSGIQGFTAAVPWLTSALVVLGLVAGYLNVTGKETKEFLWVAIALVIVSYTAPGALEKLTIGQIGTYLQNVFGQIMAFVVPATIVVALKDVWSLGQNPE